MALEIVRRIRGNVHGTIDVTALEDAVIDHPYVQRLRRIRQLAFLQFVFPGASHSRFEHSLGVMQLAGMAWERMQLNQRRLHESARRYADFASREGKKPGAMVHGLLAPTFPLMDKLFGSDYVVQTLRLAGLMHDLGHPPFSHSGERFLPSWQDVIDGARDEPDYLQDYLRLRADRIAARGGDPKTARVRHEVFTLLMVEQVMRETYEQHPELSLVIDPRDVMSVMAPEISPKEGSPLAEHGIHKLLHELVSGELDIDRMDYLLRDSRECGVVYGIFDAGRILDSLALYFDPADAGLHVAIHFSGLAAFEDYLRARYSMYLQLYFHKTAVAGEAMFQHLGRLLGGWTLPARLGEYAEIDEYNIADTLLAAARAVIKDGATRAAFERSLRDLLFDRRFWKRVYEVSGTLQTPPSQKTLETAREIIRGLHVNFEEVSSADSLTRFRPRQKNERSRNYLRLIKKDEWQFPRVVPIEDYARVIDGNASVHITRLYVESGKDAKDGKSIPEKVKRRLTEAFADGVVSEG